MTRVLSLWPPQLQNRVNLQILQYNQDDRWPILDDLPSPLLTQNQPMHRNLQLARVEKCTVSKLFLFWFLEALDRPSRKLQ